MLQLPPLNKVAVSSCLIGKRCRYDGETSRNIEKFSGCVHICPEVLGGLPIPRVPCEITSGDGYDVLSGKTKVIGRDKVDRTNEYIAGANSALKICLEKGIEAVILKEKSPSCGCTHVYNEGKIVDGKGVAAALLKSNGIKIISDTEVL